MSELQITKQIQNKNTEYKVANSNHSKGAAPTTFLITELISQWTGEAGFKNNLDYQKNIN